MDGSPPENTINEMDELCRDDTVPRFGNMQEMKKDGIMECRFGITYRRNSRA